MSDTQHTTEIVNLRKHKADLLAACEELINVLHAFGRCPFGCTFAPQPLNDCQCHYHTKYCQARTAIAKANEL